MAAVVVNAGSSAARAMIEEARALFGEQAARQLAEKLGVPHAPPAAPEKAN